MGSFRKLFTPPRLMLGAALLLAIFTRFYQLGSESLWLDEAITFHRSRLPIRELIADALQSYHNPAYFMLIHFSMKLGDSEAMLRLPSALFGVFTVLIVFAIGRVAKGDVAGLGAALAIGLNPRAVEYAQEARMYALSCLGASAAVYGVAWLFTNPTEAAFPVWRLVRRAATRSANEIGARRAWIAFAVGCAVTLYSHATGVLFVVACSIVALLFLAFRPLERRGFFLNWLIVNVVVVLTFLPWLPSLFHQTQEMGRRGFWMNAPTSHTVLNAIRSVFLFGRHAPWLSALVLALMLLGSVALRKRPLLLAALWLLTALAPGLLLLASLRQPIFMPRLFLWGLIPWSVIAGAGFSLSKRALVIAPCMLLFTGLAGHALQEDYYSADMKAHWREALTRLSSVASPRVKILATGGREGRLLGYYLGRNTDPIRAFDYVAMESGSKPELNRAIGRADTVWTVQGRNSDTADRVRALLKPRARRVQHYDYGNNVRLARYSLRRPHQRRP